jgi:hypothetical protein
MLCVRNSGCDDLESRKVYRILPDASAAESDYLRVVDESGEGYLYPAGYFVPVELPAEVAAEWSRIVEPDQDGLESAPAR